MYKDELWRYVAYLGYPHDGDTFEECVIDMGLRHWQHMRDPKDKSLAIRLANINCPELTKPGGPEALAFTQAWVQAHNHDMSGQFFLRFFHVWQDDFGRFLAMVQCSEGHVLNDDLVASGHAVPFMVQRT